MSEWLVNLGSNGLVTVLLIVVMSVMIVALVIGYRKRCRMEEKLSRLERDLRIANGGAVGMGQQLIALEKQIEQQLVTTFVKKEPKSREVKKTNQQQAFDDYPTVTNTTKSDTNRQNSASQYDTSQDRTPQQLAAKTEHSVEDHSNEDDVSSYDQARLLLEQGNVINDVAKQCGLSYAEVSLLQALSKKVTP